MILKERLVALRKKLARGGLSQDETAWLLGACDDLNRQWELVHGQVGLQLEGFERVIKAQETSFPEE